MAKFAFGLVDASRLEEQAFWIRTGNFSEPGTISANPRQPFLGELFPSERKKW
jgi:hypothetical protein